ncbi:MAG: hypothetical protein ISS62_04690 [Desulfobacteraceae bacterium]|nr:hypothetical protein [Desulfobacteraceae bacterium]
MAMMSGGENRSKDNQEQKYHLDILTIQHHRKPDISAMLGSLTMLKYLEISER